MLLASCYTCAWMVNEEILQQEVVTLVLRSATRDCDPVYSRCRCGLPYFPHILQKKSHRHSRILPWSLHGSLAFLAVWSLAVKQCDHTVMDSIWMVTYDPFVAVCLAYSLQECLHLQRGYIVAFLYTYDRTEVIYEVKMCAISTLMNKHPKGVLRQW